MRFFVFFLFLIPGSLSACPHPPVTGPKEMVVKSGSCLYISCRYDLCQAGPDAQLTQLDWIHHPDYDQESRKFLGRTVTQLPRTPEANQGGCDLTLPHVGPQHAGKYGLRLVAKPSRRSYKELLWMHPVIVNVTDTPPAPHLWPPPAPLTHGRRTTFGCWVPPACPGDALALSWEGPATKTAGVFEDTWTPPANVTPHPAVGTLLAFDPFWYHDGTRLNCTLRDPDGRTISRASRLLQVNHAPRDVVVEVTPPSPTSEGQEVTLSCRDSAKPPSETYSWSLGGRVLPHSGAQLLLKPVRGADGGSYSCRATNAVGTAQSAAVTLEVRYAPRDAWVEVTPPSPVPEGTEVTLSCRVSCHPRPHAYAWSLGGRLLPHGGAQLLLGATAATDGGAYSCRATNSLGTATSPNATLEVYFPPRSAILENLTSLPALIGSRVALRCLLGPAHPTPLIQWLRQDQKEAAGPPGPTLTFQADPARAGTYHCIGQNPAGSTLSPPLDVVVWYPPKNVRVLQTPGGSVLAGAGPVRLSCQIGGGDPPDFQVTWFKDGGQLPDPAPDLLLPGPEPADAATYNCQARNRAGVAYSPPLALDVHFAPQGVELVAEPEAGVEERSDVTLRCHARARPPPHTFYWFRDGTPVGSTPRGLWVLRGVGTRASGRYRCSVTNAVATRHSDDVIVTVYYSTSTILRRTSVGLAVGLGLLSLLAAVGCFLRRRWRRQRAADEEPVVEPSGTFFLRRKESPLAASPRAPAGPQDAGDAGDAAVVVPSAVVTPPWGGPGHRLRGDTVVYTVLKRKEGATKATEGPDYENVPAGPSAGDAGDREGTLVYAALALSPPGPPRGHRGDVGDTVEYVALKH